MKRFLYDFQLLSLRRDWTFDAYMRAIYADAASGLFFPLFSQLLGNFNTYPHRKRFGCPTNMWNEFAWYSYCSNTLRATGVLLSLGDPVEPGIFWCCTPRSCATSWKPAASWWSYGGRRYGLVLSMRHACSNSTIFHLSLAHSVRRVYQCNPFLDLTLQKLQLDIQRYHFRRDRAKAERNSSDGWMLNALRSAELSVRLSTFLCCLIERSQHWYPANIRIMPTRTEESNRLLI